jgi:hypothetical protein
LQRGDRGSIILDLGVGVLELARLAAALTEVAVVEGQAGNAALGQRLCPGAGGLFLHARQGAGHHGNAGFAGRRPMEGSDQLLTAATECEPGLHASAP